MGVISKSVPPGRFYLCFSFELLHKIPLPKEEAVGKVEIDIGLLREGSADPKVGMMPPFD